MIKEKEIIRKIFFAKKALEKAGNKKVFGKFGLTASLYICLARISFGMKSITQMKKHFDESMASFGQKIQKLEVLGLVERELNSEDKRKWNFKLTKKGKQILEKVEKKFDEASKDIFLDFSQKEKEDLWKLLEKIESNLIKFK